MADREILSWDTGRGTWGGVISVQADGSLLIAPDDDYYTGVLPPDQAAELARAILARTKKDGAA